MDYVDPGVFLHLSQRAEVHIGRDTSISNKFVTSFVDKRVYELVFSDEFEKENRFFHDGYDPKWTAMNKDDYTNFALQYYKSDLATTTNGFLNIRYRIKVFYRNGIDNVPISHLMEDWMP